MITYVVKYRKKGSFFWKMVKNVTGDVLPKDLPGFKVLVLSDESQVHVPLDGTEFWFSKERFMSIKKRMEQESGQQLQMNR